MNQGLRVTMEELEALIKHEQYLQIPDTTLTICILHLVTGFLVVGHSACLDPAMFNRRVGEEEARSNAFDQLWPLVGFAKTAGHAV